MRVFGSSVLLAVSVVALQSFAVAQTSPPPPDYQQPPPGYQQQPPPGYQQQPPPGYQQQPPPGYQQPPPAGYPPPQAYGNSAPPPGYAAAPPVKSGFLALPYLGISSLQGTTGENNGAGFLLGALLGGRINPMLSLNGEVRFDILNPKNVNSGYDVGEAEFALSFSPLFHAPFPQGEFVIGPKLGIFGYALEAKYGGQTVDKVSASGLELGANAGVFFNISPTVALGGILSFTVRDPSKVCETVYGYAEQCNDSTDFDSQKVLGIHAGALF